MIGNICISNGDSAKGPRGIALGMSLEDVLDCFCCTNQTVMRYSKTFDTNLFSQNDQTALYLYEMEDATGNTYSFLLPPNNERKEISLGYVIGDCINMSLSFENNTLTQIDVWYYYGE